MTIQINAFLVVIWNSLSWILWIKVVQIILVINSGSGAVTEQTPECGLATVLSVSGWSGNVRDKLMLIWSRTNQFYYQAPLLVELWSLNSGFTAASAYVVERNWFHPVRMITLSHCIVQYHILLNYISGITHKLSSWPMNDPPCLVWTPHGG